MASFDAKITNVEQIVSSLAARVIALETTATSVSSGSGSAKSWNVLGYSDGSTATILSGLTAQGHLTTIEIRDVGLVLSQTPKTNMRSAVLLQVPL